MAYWCWHNPFNTALDCLGSNQQSLDGEKMQFIKKLSPKKKYKISVESEILTLNHLMCSEHSKFGRTQPFPASLLKLHDGQHVTLGLEKDFCVQIQCIYGSPHICQYIFQCVPVLSLWTTPTQWIFSNVAKNNRTEKTMFFLSSGFQERHIYNSKWKLIVLWTPASAPPFSFDNDEDFIRLFQIQS